MSEDLKVRLKRLINLFRKKNYGYRHPQSRISYNVNILKPENLYMYEKTGIGFNSVIMNWRAKFIMKRYSGAAFGLKVITGNHMRIKGKMYKHISDKMKDSLDTGKDFDQDVIVEEDVWIGSNVTLLSGVHLGRGSDIGSGSVVRGSIPPYSVVMGNPAKVVGFVFTPKEIIEHEKDLYPEEERLPLELLESNYKKYFLSRMKEIREFTRL